MESFGNEIRVQQGEQWGLDLLVSASSKEYIPYIVSSERPNPYFVVTIASTKYEKNRRYIKSWWNSVTDSQIPTFYDTNPYFYGNIVTKDDLPDSPNSPNIVDEVTSSKNERYLYQYTVDYLAVDVDDTTVGTYYVYDTDENEWIEKILPTEYDSEDDYYKKEEVDKALGHKPYYYFYFDYNDLEHPVRVDNYECRIRQEFLSTDTAEWGSQNYLYQITLVGGTTMNDKLDAVYDWYKPDNWPVDREAQYKFVKINYPDEFQPDIDIDSPLGSIDTPETILQPTHLEVYNNLRKLI